MLDSFFTADPDEAERLKAVEREAQQRYYEAVETSDLSSMRRAADAWIKAGDAVTEYSWGTTTPTTIAAGRRSSSG
jgi:hypothetical protein